MGPMKSLTAPERKHPFPDRAGNLPFRFDSAFRGSLAPSGVREFQRMSTRVLVSLALACALATGPALSQTAYPLDARPGPNARALDMRASETFRTVVSAVRNRRTEQARAARDRLPAGSFERHVADWVIAAHGTSVPATELAAVLASHADWPLEQRVRIRLERAILRSDPGPEALVLAFSAAAPESIAAQTALAEAHLAAGDRDAAASLVRRIWRDETLDASEESSLGRRFGSLLRREDHRARLERLLAVDRLRAAARIAGDAGATRLAAAFSAVTRKNRDAGRRLAAVPAFQRTDPAYAVARSRHERRRENFADAAAVLRQSKASSTQALGDALWREHRIVAKELLRRGNAAGAYRLASRSVAVGAKARADAAFLAGWIALRRRNDPARAERHFADLAGIATLPPTKARAGYWTGRAREQAGRNASAAYRRAARYDTTFYGQLAAARLGQAIAVDRARPSDAAERRLAATPLYAAMRLLESADAQGYARAFRTALAQRLDDPAMLAQIALEAERRGDHRSALLVGRLAAARGLPVDSLSHPLGAIPSGHGLSKGHLALAYAVARQESSFQIDARSGANALGLMQLLPGTARQTARGVGLPYSLPRLTRDPAYNVRLGTSFLVSQVEAFGGSLPLALAAYNAGPRRAREWARDIGDPRTMSPDDAVDWIESIPFAETRAYVQKVLANRGVYRTRLIGAGDHTVSALNGGRP